VPHIASLGKQFLPKKGASREKTLLYKKPSMEPHHHTVVSYYGGNESLTIEVEN
jgi:hypothetical protein